MQRGNVFLVVAATALVSVFITTALLYRADPSAGLDAYGFVDVDEIVRKDSYFRNAQKEWTRDRRRLRRDYLQQLRGLDIRADRVTSLMSGSQASSKGVQSDQGSLHQHGRTVHGSGNRESGSSGVLRTIMTRKFRVDTVMRQKQKEINREGRRRIQNAIKRVAQRRNIKRVFDRGDLLYEADGDVELPEPITDSRDITGAVLEELSSDS